MIETIYLDMDGVIVDFTEGCKRINAIEGRKVDWKLVHENGQDFWSELDWTPEGKKVYEFVSKICKENNIDLCILSSVNYEDGINGKYKWLIENTDIPNQNIYIVPIGKDKRKYAKDNALLIDDFDKNVKCFIDAGGNGIWFKNFNQMKEDLLEFI